MALNFDKLPTDKPGQSNITDGQYEAVIFDAKMVQSKSTPGTEYLNVSFKTSDGFVNENYFDSDKPFLQYKLGRLLSACKVQLSGEGSLKDVAKVVKGKQVIIDVAVNDRGYGALDYSGSHEGIYPISHIEVNTENTLDADIAEAIGTEVTMDDEEF